MESKEENDPIDVFIGQSFGTEPILPSQAEDTPEHWTQLLDSADQPEVPGLPVPTPVEDKKLKCENCSSQFCSPVNYRRHIRTHRPSLKKSSNLDKEFQKNRDLLAAYWDELTLEEVNVIMSVNDVMLKETRGASIVEALTSSLHRIGVVYPLPLVYTSAGLFLLDFILAQPLSLPISAFVLFSVLEDASENTFLCGGPPESLVNYIFEGETGRNILDLKNLVASASFLVENKLVRAWVDAKNAESLRCQKLLEEEEKAEHKQKADALEKKNQKRLRQKDKKKELENKGGSEDPPASLRAIGTQSVPENNHLEQDGDDNQEQRNFSNQPINHDDSDTIEPKRQVDLPKKKKHKKKKAKKSTDLDTTHHVEEIDPLLPLAKGSTEVPSDLSSPNDQTEADDNQLAQGTFSKQPLNQGDSETIEPQGQNCQTFSRTEPAQTLLTPSEDQISQNEAKLKSKVQSNTKTIKPPTFNHDNSETVEPQGQSCQTLDKPEPVHKVIPQKDQDLQQTGPETLETIEPQGQNRQTSVTTNDEILESEAKMETEVHTIEQPYINQGDIETIETQGQNHQTSVPTNDEILESEAKMETEVHTIEQPYINQGDFETIESQGQNRQTSGPTNDWILHKGGKVRLNAHGKTQTMKPPALPVKYVSRGGFDRHQGQNRQTSAPTNYRTLHRRANMRSKVHQSRALPVKYMGRGGSKAIEPQGQNYQPVQKATSPKDHGDIETIKQPALREDSETVKGQGQNSETISEPPELPVKGSNETEENNDVVITVGSMPVIIEGLPYFNTAAAKVFMKKQWDEALSGDHEVYMSSYSLDNENNTCFVHPYLDANQAPGSST